MSKSPTNVSNRFFEEQASEQITARAHHDLQSAGARSQQRFAFICVTVALLIGALTFEVVVGGEPEPPTVVWPPSSLMKKAERREVAQSVLTASLDGLMRMKQNELIAKKLSSHAQPSSAAVAFSKAGQTKSYGLTKEGNQAKSVSLSVPDSLQVDPILELMPVASWVTKTAYRELDRRYKNVGLRRVADGRITLDMARQSSMPGLMRLMSSIDFASETRRSVSQDSKTLAQAIPALTGETAEAITVASGTLPDPVRGIGSHKHSRSTPKTKGLVSVETQVLSGSKSKRTAAPSDSIVAVNETIVDETIVDLPRVVTAPAEANPQASILQRSPVTIQPDVTTTAEMATQPTSPAMMQTAREPARPAELPLPTVATDPPDRMLNESRHTSAPIAPAIAAPQAATQWPLANSASGAADTVTLNVNNTDVRSVLDMLARGYGMNILISPDVTGVVNANIEGLSPDQTLQGVLKMCDLQAQVDQGVIYVYSADKMPDDARVVRHFRLDYARAATIEPAIQGLLSPIGNAYVNNLDATDNRNTEEAIVVIDTLNSIARIESYLMQVDRAPRQVMIEARILEVELSDDLKHGVDFSAILGGDLQVSALGLADGAASVANPLFFAQIDGSRVDALIDSLETTTDAKTLATPRVMVLNGQNARIQVGQQLGFTVATVTQTSTIQDVQFLETGVVLSVTPTISRDDQVMMQVKPEVSNGQINPSTLLPEEETRELETSVLLNNHQGVVIGGLIQENDRTVIRKLPWLGDVKHVGKLFQRREEIRSRSEIIIALVPHIIEMDEHPERENFDHERWRLEYERTNGPLFYGPLQRGCRPWEPRMPDVVRQSPHLDVNKINRMIPR